MCTTVFTIANKMGAEQFGTRMREAREAKGWSLTRLAERMARIPGASKEYTRGYLSQIETGKRNPKAPLKHIISVALGMPADAGDPELDMEDLEIEGIRASLLTMRELDPNEVRRVAVVVEAMVEDLKRRRREEDEAERRRRAAEGA
jgi:transcriptional regulator with XRE-family HTH domain